MSASSGRDHLPPVVAAVDPLVWQLAHSRAQEARWPYRVLHELAVEFDGVHAAHRCLREVLQQVERDGRLPDDMCETLARAEGHALPACDTSELFAVLQRQGLTAAAADVQSAQLARVEALQVLRDLRSGDRTSGRPQPQTTLAQLQAADTALTATATVLAAADRRIVDAMPTLGHPTLTTAAMRRADRERLQERPPRSASADGCSL